MSIRTRIFLAFFLAGAAGLGLLANWARGEVRRHYLQSMEESLIDTANILGSILGDRFRGGAPDTADFRRAFEAIRRTELSARIYDLVKTGVDLRVYVTDDRGVVVFDSDGGRDEGRDYSQWNDVYRTLRGLYGARATRSDPRDPRSSVHCVAAPVRAGGRIVGVVTVCKPVAQVYRFIDNSQRKIAFGALGAGAVLLGLSYAISLWVTRPIQKLTDYARAVRDGQRAELPALGRSEIGAMGAAFDQMREALEGRQYVEQFVQTLTHEIKSPLSAIRGAAELLAEDLPPERRARFLANIRGEAERIQQLVDRLLELAALESRRGLRDVQDLDLAELAAELAESLAPALEARGLALRNQAGEPLAVRGERFLVRQALANLLQNAIDFSPRGGEITLSLALVGSAAELAVSDRGPGVPDYALGRVFEKFYSLPRPEAGRKGTGLGLALVREVAELHGGQARIENLPAGGARAVLSLPLASPPTAK